MSNSQRAAISAPPPSSRRFDLDDPSLAEGVTSAAHLAGILAEQRDQARNRVREQQQSIVALHATCQRYRAELQILRAQLEEIDEDSEARVEQLVSLQVALSSAEQRACEADERARHSEELLDATRRELERCRSAQLNPEALSKAV